MAYNVNDSSPVFMEPRACTEAQFAVSICIIVVATVFAPHQVTGNFPVLVVKAVTPKCSVKVIYIQKSVKMNQCLMVKNRRRQLSVLLENLGFALRRLLAYV
jgi:hypothetical protein